MGFFEKVRQARAALTAPESVATLDHMHDYFANGENWTKGVYSAANGARCLVGAADHVRVSAVDDAKYHLRQAIAEREPHLRTIEQFNDTRDDFGEIAAVIRRAKELAQAAQLSATRPAAALPAPVAEVLPPKPAPAKAGAPAWLPAPRPAPAAQLPAVRPAAALPAARPAPVMIDVTPDQVRGRLPQPESPRWPAPAPPRTTRRRRSLFWEILSD